MLPEGEQETPACYHAKDDEDETPAFDFNELKKEWKKMSAERKGNEHQHSAECLARVARVFNPFLLKSLYTFRLSWTRRSIPNTK